MPFNSQEFLKFAKEWDFHVTTTSPLYPQANGQVERFVGIIKTAMKKSQDPKIAILQYRNTPITGLKYSPAQLLFNRRLGDNIPTLKINLKPAIPAKARQELETLQQKQKVFFDRHAEPYNQDFNKGDKPRVHGLRAEYTINTKLAHTRSTPTVIKLCTGATHALSDMLNHHQQHQLRVKVIVTILSTLTMTRLIQKPP
ncbi:retrovirus-related pol polyprotein from transposon 17.6 [Plakobranchus ocellatus]|uniref:Retrovirus-related pol polyprotein from transposon 17.6 n=1 Tax=Plakobranchus ocellatus TaxID=259542 RepID=A0AAV3ZWY9_9GAST|nr:retrovirus-related pol polyprotein from transposon 17.6 [Plakobranchus ocellatus]